MVQIDKLIKVGNDILNSEGMILGLFSDKNKNLVLRSILKDGSGFVFFSTNVQTLNNYFTSEITLDQLYIESEDDWITIQYRNRKTDLFNKIYFVSKIQCCEEKYSENPKDIRGY